MAHETEVIVVHVAGVMCVKVRVCVSVCVCLSVCVRVCVRGCASVGVCVRVCASGCVKVYGCILAVSVSQLFLDLCLPFRLCYPPSQLAFFLNSLYTISLKN